MPPMIEVSSSTYAEVGPSTGWDELGVPNQPTLRGNTVFAGAPQGVLAFLVLAATAAQFLGQTDYVNLRVCNRLYPPGNHTNDTATTPNFLLFDGAGKGEVFGPGNDMDTAVAVAGVCNSKNVTSQSAEYMQYMTLAQSLPAIGVVGAAGTISDSYGRRIVILVSLTSLLLASVLNFATAWWSLSLHWLLVANGMSGLTGNFLVMLMAIFASVTDISDRSSRTVLVAKAEGSIFLGAGIGYYLYGQISKNYGFGPLFAIATGINLLAWLFAFFAVAETLPNAQRRKWPGWCVANPLASIAVLFRTRVLIALSIIFSIQCAIYFGYPVVFTYYTKNHFGWASNTNGLFGMLDDFARGFGMVVLLPIAVWALGGKALSCAPMVTRKPHQRDKLFLCVALVVTMAQYGAYAFVPASASNTFLGLTAAGIVGGVQAPLLRGLFSKQYEPHEYGICFGAIATMESTFQLVWPIVLEAIYKATTEPIAGSRIDEACVEARQAGASSINDNRWEADAERTASESKRLLE
eukprot:gene15088-26453_t